MPKIDGITMLKNLKETMYGKEVPVIIPTNTQNSQNISEAMTHKVFHMVKPDFDVNKLLESARLIIVKS